MNIEKSIVIDVNGKKKSFPHFFQATGYANADYTYTPAVERMYDYLSSYNGHPKYMRLHNIMTLHGKGDYYKFEFGSDYGNPIPPMENDKDIVVTRDKDGHLVYDWTYVDKVYDIITSHEMIPIVEAVYMPSCLRKDKWICTPADYNEYMEVLKAFVIHWTERYGRDAVRTWYFEIINEPENYAIINERPEVFMALYDYFEAAIHSVDEEYRVGGPAVKQWEEGKRIFDLFLQHCESGVNYVSGTFGTRIDFISVHCKAGYPTMVGPQLAYMFDSLKEYSEILNKYPTLKDKPFFNDESDIVWDGNMGTWYKSWLNFRNTEYAPGFICKMINHYCDVLVDELGINLAVVDSDNSHLPWEKYLFSGNRSQLTPLGNAPCTDLIRKGFFNAGHLLGRLGDERFILNSEDPEFGDKYGCLATEFSNGDGYAFMLWNFEDGLDASVNERQITLKVDGIKGKYNGFSYRIDSEHSNPYHIWAEMGKPQNPTIEQIETLRANDSLALEEDGFIADSSLSKTFRMPMHSVVLVILSKDSKDRESISIKSIESETGVNGNDQAFIVWDYSKRNDFKGYNLYRNGEKVNMNILTSSCFTDSQLDPHSVNSYEIETVYACEAEKSEIYKLDAIRK